MWRVVQRTSRRAIERTQSRLLRRAQSCSESGQRGSTHSQAVLPPQNFRSRSNIYGGQERVLETRGESKPLYASDVANESLKSSHNDALVCLPLPVCAYAEPRRIHRDLFAGVRPWCVVTRSVWLARRVQVCHSLLYDGVALDGRGRLLLVLDGQSAS